MKRDPFRVEGVGCWCDQDMTLRRLLLEGHTERCTQARKGWEANYRHLSQIDQQRRVDQEVGRQIREAAEAALMNQTEDASQRS